MTAGAPSQTDRAACARAALERAERRTGARSVRTAAVRPVEADPLASAVPGGAGGRPPRERPGPDGPATPRAPVAAIAVAGSQGEPATALLVAERPPMPVPDVLAPLLPSGLRRGTTIVVDGSTSLVLALVAQACSGGAWAAIVGQPSVGLLAAAQAGVALDRLAVVPWPGAFAADVLAALVDGVDVVVAGPEARLPEHDQRRISARVRERGGVLVSTVGWPGASTALTIEASRWAGAGTGEGRLRAQRVRVVRSGQAGASVPVALELTLPLGVDGAGAASLEPLSPESAAARPTPTESPSAGASREHGKSAPAELRLVG